MREFDPSWREDDLSWFRLGLHILSERRRLVLSVLLVLSLPLAAYALLVPEVPVFEARVLVQVESERTGMKDYTPTTEAADAEDSYYETQYRVLRSRTLARQTLSHLTPVAGRSASNTTAQPAATSGADGPRKSEPNQNPANNQGAPVDGADTATNSISKFLAALDVYHIPASRLIELRFRSEDPQYAARAVTVHTQTYVRQSVESTLRTSRQTSDWLTRQMEDQRARVEKGESAVQKYQQQYGAVEERQTVVSQRLSELNGAVLRARAQRIAKEASYQQLKDAASTGNPRNAIPLISTPAVQQLALELSGLERRDLELSAEYGERFPDRVKIKDAVAFTTGRLDAEITRAVEAVASDLAVAREEEAKMVAALEAETSAASLLGRRAADFETLKREVATDRALFEKLRDRAREVNIADDYQLSNIRVIDAAEVPRIPLPSTKLRNLALAAGASIVLTMLLALAVHVMDERLRSSEDVKVHLGLPYLGLVPKLNGAGPNTYVFREAMRDLRTQIMCSNGRHAARALLVASADEDEGKTLVATNLAMGLAQIGRRVLLIDVDLRRPSVHEAFGVSVAPGLSEVLSGTAHPHDSCRSTSQPNLWILTAGRSQTHPGDLLSSDTFERMMTGFSAAFDVVVIDSPPVMSATDATLLAHQKASTIFVVSADRTGRRAAQAAIERLESVGATFVGVVLNRVDFARNGSPYYQRAHYYTYRDNGRIKAPAAHGAPAEAAESELST